MAVSRYYLVLDENEERIATFDMGLEDELIEFIKNNPEAVYLDIKEQNSQETGFSKKPKYTYHLFWERDINPIEKLDTLRSDLDEKLVMKDPQDRRKRVIVPEEIENVINSPEFQKVKDICKEYYSERMGIETYYDPENRTFTYYFTFASKYGYPDKKFLEEFYKRFGFNDLQKLATHQDGYSEYEGFLTIGGCNVRIDVSSNFRIYSINISDDKTEILEDLEEDIEKHDTLNQKLFDGEELKPEVKDTIENVVELFIQELEEEGIRFDLKDILLIGSNVNYNYTKDSDLDVHIIADSTHLECPNNLYPLLYSAYRSMFNKNYDITIKGIPLELYVEMDELGGKSNGIYSLKTGWVKRPVQKDIPNLDREAFDKLFKEWEDKYFDLIGNQNILTEAKSDDIYDFIEDLYDLRKESIASEGEFGLGNLVFKEFRNLGYLDNLKELRKTEKGKELSLEQLGEGTNA